MVIGEKKNSTANRGSGKNTRSSLCSPQLPIPPYLLFITNSLYTCLPPCPCCPVATLGGKIFFLLSLKDHMDLVKDSMIR